MSLVRQALSVFILPFTVVVVVPYFLLASTQADPVAWQLQVAGFLLFALGFGLAGWCVLLFASLGQGTLAPWDPTRKLVVAGPYQTVRNPMITGVAAMLLGEALLFGSEAVGVWSLVFVVVNHLYFILSEEPGLEKRFGKSYLKYKSRVPRWLPGISWL
jgi:protein-S-isoprenylcysteine O-methyltransferase Ste14